MTAHLKEPLRAALGPFMERQRWYGGKGRRAEVRIADVHEVRPGLLRVIAVAGADRYQLLLGEADVARLCQAELGRTPTPDFVRDVLHASGGLPLGIHELCSAALTDGDDVKNLSGAGLRERARQKLAAASADARRVAVSVALAGHPIPPAQALAIADAPGETLAQLVADGIAVVERGALALSTAAHVEVALTLQDCCV